MPDADGLQGPDSQRTLRSELRERSKELGFLHHATRIIHSRGEPRDTLRAVLELLPTAMCYPELAGARLCLGPLEIRTQGYEQSELSLRAAFSVHGGGDGFVEVCYAPAPPSSPAFLGEEQSLLGSLAELLRGHFELMRAETGYQRLLQVEAEQQSVISDGSAKEQFLSTVSHELRASLDVMRGWIQVLEQGTDGPDLVARGLQILERNIALQTRLVEDLGDPSCIDSGQLRLDLVRLDLAELVGLAVEAQRPSAEAKRLHLSAQVESVGYVLGDPQRLQQVVDNVLANAVQFTPSGGSIHVELTPDGSNARIVVHDTGIGIASELLPHLFERRSPAAVAVPSHPGTLGLGLPLAGRLIERHGGTISIHSHQPEPGTAIEIKLPLHARAASA